GQADQPPSSPASGRRCRVARPQDHAPRESGVLSEESERIPGRLIGGRMDLGLKGKKAVVTGGSKGIGRAIVETFAAEGADVALCARTAADVESAVSALKSKGVKAFGRALDVADGDALKAWIAEAGGALGGIDALVCNVSALAVGDSAETWEKS